VESNYTLINTNMVKIENRQTDINSGEGTAHYSDLLKIAVNSTTDGVTVAEMAKRLRLMAVIESGAETLEFEDSDFALLKELYNKVKWSVVHKDLVALQEELSKS